MNPKLVEIALRKQRLQFRAERERAEMMAGLAAVDVVLDGVDRLRDGVDWLRQHAPAVSTFALVLLLMRPRFTLRWAKRGVLGWQLYRRLRVGLEAALSRP